MLQHLLFAFLAIALPAWDFYATRRLKKNPGSAQKIGYYKTLCALLWIASVVAVATVGIRAAQNGQSRTYQLSGSILGTLWNGHFVTGATTQTIYSRNGQVSLG